MPIKNETPNTVTVGFICYSCAMRATRQCPYGNHLIDKVTAFRGDIRGKCHYYLPLVEAEGNGNMMKEAAMISEAQLNVDLYRKMSSLTDKQRKDLFAYWSYVFPKNYAEDMVTDSNETEQKIMKKMKDKSKKKFYENDKNTKNKKDNH